MRDAKDLDDCDISARARVFNGDVFAAQRQLRGQLLDVAVTRYTPARDLAAHMLLHLDDLTACWALATNWLRAGLGCQRVDAGFGMRRAKDHYPGLAEAKNADFDVPSFGGTAVDNHDPVMQAMWHGPRPLSFKDIRQDRRVTPRLRQRMSGARTQSKFGGALRTANGSFGLICTDWTEHTAPQEQDLYNCFEQTVADVLSPFIAVARLVAKGMSYKEIARLRGRSFSTIDHQLRSIRQKTGAASTVSLVSLLAKADLPPG